MKHILVVGSSNTDMILRVARIPRPGETILGGAFAMAAGGKGANQAVAAARAGGRVTFVARVGDDVFGRTAVANFEADGVDTRFVTRTPGEPSGVALINVAENGENSISVAPGANARLSVDDIHRAAEAFAAADIVLLQLEIPMEAVVASVRKARERGVPVILNPAPARPLDGGLLRAIDVLTPNEHEAGLLSGIPVTGAADAGRAASRLKERGPRLVVITLGEEGLYAQGDEFAGAVPAFKVRVVDTTAAGDVFNGSLAVALAENMSVPDALRFASASAALSVTKLGAQPSAPTRSEIQKLLE